MKFLIKWVFKLFAFTFFLWKQAALHGENSLMSGIQFVHEIDSSYRNGEYDAFLSSIHTHYESAGKAGALRWIFQNTKKAVGDTHHNTLDYLERNGCKIAELSKKRDQRLLHAISENPDLDIVQKVDSIVFTGITLEQEKILAELEILKFHIPETSEATLENKISSLETEYYIKELLLNVVDHVSKSIKDDLKKKKIVIQLAKLDKMYDVATEYGEKTWIEKLKKAKSAYRAKRALSMDYKLLQSLGRGTKNPENSVEKKVKEIMIEYLDNEDQILAEFISSQ